MRSNQEVVFFLTRSTPMLTMITEDVKHSAMVKTSSLQERNTLASVTVEIHRLHPYTSMRRTYSVIMRVLATPHKLAAAPMSMAAASSVFITMQLDTPLDPTPALVEAAAPLTLVRQ